MRNKKNNNKKRIKTLEKTEKEMKTNLPSTIRLIFFFFFLFFFFGVSVRFYLIKYPIVYSSFEGRTEMSIEVLTSVCAVFTVGCMRDSS